MTDTVSKKKRSEIMSAVKSKETKIEIAFSKSLWKSGLRYRKNPTKYFGKPDIVLKKLGKLVIIKSNISEYYNSQRTRGLYEINL